MRRTALLLLLAPATLPAQRLPDPQVTTLFTAGDDAALVLPAPLPRIVLLRWNRPVAIALSQGDGDIVARYPAPPSETAIAAFARAAGPRIGRFDWGPDNLLLRAAPGTTLSAAVLPDGLAVTITPVTPAPAPAGDPATTDDTITTTLLLAQAEAASGYPGRARRRLAPLAAAHPASVEVQSALAAAESAAGRPRAAARRYAALPDGGGPAGRAAARLVGPSVETTLLVRDGSGFSQSELTLRGGAPVSPDVRLDAAVRHVRTRGDDPAGTPAPRRVAATEAGIAATVDATPALRLRFDLTGLVDGRGVGGAMAAAWGDPERRGGVRLAWHLPDFATPAGALYRGWADRATLGGVLRFAPGASVRLDGSVVHYGLYDGAGGATTAAFDGGIDYLIRRQSPALTLGYRLDAEYVIDRRTAAPLDPYATLADRENHTVEAGIAQPLADHVGLSGTAGWTVNRLGGDGPTAAIGLTLLPVDGWEGSLFGGISSIARPGQPARQYYGRAALTRRFGSQP